METNPLLIIIIIIAIFVFALDTYIIRLENKRMNREIEEKLNNKN